jgi:hypothetical protein
VFCLGVGRGKKLESRLLLPIQGERQRSGNCLESVTGQIQVAIANRPRPPTGLSLKKMVCKNCTAHAALRLVASFFLQPTLLLVFTPQDLCLIAKKQNNIIHAGPGCGLHIVKSG